MKIQKIVFSIAIACLLLIGCKNEIKKETLLANSKNVTLSISGMTCEIGCAKTIQSKLSKKEGVLDANVIFKDSIATIAFDANKTSQKELISFVEGIAGGDFYKASLVSKKACKKTCEKECCTANEKKETKKECKADCKKACCPKKTA
jgi:periplasmic mercuric ion binding protein